MQGNRLSPVCTGRRHCHKQKAQGLKSSRHLQEHGMEKQLILRRLPLPPHHPKAFQGKWEAAPAEEETLCIHPDLLPSWFSDFYLPGRRVGDPSLRKGINPGVKPYRMKHRGLSANGWSWPPPRDLVVQPMLPRSTSPSVHCQASLHHASSFPPQSLAITMWAHRPLGVSIYPDATLELKEDGVWRPSWRISASLVIPPGESHRNHHVKEFLLEWSTSTWNGPSLIIRPKSGA